MSQGLAGLPDQPFQPPHPAVTPRAGATSSPASGRLKRGVRRQEVKP